MTLVCLLPQILLEVRLQPLLHSRHNNRPIRQKYDKEHLSHRSFNRVRKADQPEWTGFVRNFCVSSAPDLDVIKSRHKIGGDFSRFFFRYGVRIMPAQAAALDTIAAPETTHQKIQEISEKAGFNARAPRRSSVKPEVANKPEVFPERRRGRRTKTGRTLSFNTKIKPETYEKIRSLSDKATEREGRPVSFAEIIERGIEKLE